MRNLVVTLPALVLAALSAGCAGSPPVANAERVSCWNVSIEGAAPRTMCRTEAQWAEFLASAGVQCKDGAPVRGMCPEYWKAREQGRSLTAANTGTNLSGNGLPSASTQFYTPTNPDMPNPQNFGNSR